MFDYSKAIAGLEKKVYTDDCLFDSFTARKNHLQLENLLIVMSPFIHWVIVVAFLLLKYVLYDKRQPKKELANGQNGSPSKIEMTSMIKDSNDQTKSADQSISPLVGRNEISKLLANSPSVLRKYTIKRTKAVDSSNIVHLEEGFESEVQHKANSTKQDNSPNIMLDEFSLVKTEALYVAKNQTVSSNNEVTISRTLSSPYKALSVFLILVNSFYPLIISTSLKNLQCIQLDSNSHKTYLMSNPDVECWGALHTFIVHRISIPALFFFGVVFPPLAVPHSCLCQEQEA